MAIRQERRRGLIALGVVGTAVFALGVFTALQRLPDWRNHEVPDAALFAARLQQPARVAGLELEATPRTRLRSKGWLDDDSALSLHDGTYDSMGPAAANWLAREGRGPFVEVAAPSHWLDDRITGGTTGRTDATHKHERGEFRVLFSLRGVPITAMWVPYDPLRSSTARKAESDARQQALALIFMPGAPAKQAGHSPPAAVFLPEIGVLTASIRIAPIPGSSPAEALIATAVEGITAPYVQRVVGSADWWRDRFEHLSLGSLVMSRLPRLIIHAGLTLGTIVLFILLLARRRIELAKGAVLGAISIALSFADPIRNAATWIQLVDPLGAVLSKGIVLFVVWSAAESWLRSTIPSFRTSLDTLRAGRLGPAGGRAMLAGWSIGAGLAGLWLAALSLGTMVPGVSPTEGSVRLPVFDAGTSPIDEGAMRTGIVLLAICAGLRLPLLRRIRGSSIVLAAILLSTRVPFTAFWVGFAVALVLAVILVRTYAGYGLTALLVAAMTSAVLPATFFGMLHFSWMPSSALVLLAVAATPLVLGPIGLRRGDDVEERPFPSPAFVRRLEEENRLKYEMDLLARMQLGLLPREMPRVDGYEIAAQSILATEAGGDLYDFVHDTAGRIWIAAGDVSGHGYSCAIAQAMTKAGLASLVEADRTPASVLGRLDHVLRGIGSPRTFTSLALLRLDPASGDVLVSNAGHPYPWIARNGSVRELELPSLPLGQGPERQYVDAPLSIEVGSAVLLCSDGLFEGIDSAGRPYGFDRMPALLENIDSLPAARILAAVIQDWRAHVGPGAPADDTTIVVIKRG